MKYLLKTILTPSCWLRVGTTSSSWDREVNLLIDNKSSVKLTRLSSGVAYSSNGEILTIELGGIGIWIGNYPYSYGEMYPNLKYPPGKLPSRKTVFKLKEYIDPHMDNLINDSIKFEGLLRTNYQEYIEESIKYYQGN